MQPSALVVLRAASTIHAVARASVGRRSHAHLWIGWTVPMVGTSRASETQHLKYSGSKILLGPIGLVHLRAT
jgi:hypothetical protein